MLGDKKGFSIVAVLIGAAVIYLGNRLVGIAVRMVIFRTGPFSAPASRTMPHPSLPSTQAMVMVVWGGMLIVGAFIATIGGVAAGSVAPTSKAEHGLGAGLVATVVPFCLTLVRMNSIFHGMAAGSYVMLSSLAFAMVSLVLTIGLAWLGGSLAAGGSRKQYPN